MNAERARHFLQSLPHAVETEQWGGLLFWVGDKSIGGKMFAMLHFDVDEAHPIQRHPITFPAGPERFAELVEQEGFAPAPYLARVFWVAAVRWDVFRDREWEEQLAGSHALILARLPPRTRAVFDFSKAEQKRLIASRRKVLADLAAAKKIAAK